MSLPQSIPRNEVAGITDGNGNAVKGMVINGQNLSLITMVNKSKVIWFA
ncbi:MAG: hypothetical protein ACLS5G_06100 [Streptococcus sp.]